MIRHRWLTMSCLKLRSGYHPITTAAGEAINAVIPPVARRGVKEKEAFFVTPCDALTKLDQQTLSQLKTRAPKQAKVLEFFSENFQEISARELIHISGCKMPGLRQLEKKGFSCHTK